jgi:hypothetical protein
LVPAAAGQTYGVIPWGVPPSGLQIAGQRMGGWPGFVTVYDMT